MRISDWSSDVCSSDLDALESRIASAIIEQAATQFFMANPKARAADYVEGFGLTAHEFELVRPLPDSAHRFLVKPGNETLVVPLDLTGERTARPIPPGRDRPVPLHDQPRAARGHYEGTRQ